MKKLITSIGLAVGLTIAFGQDHITNSVYVKLDRVAPAVEYIKTLGTTNYSYFPPTPLNIVVTNIESITIARNPGSNDCILTIISTNRP